MRLKGLPIHLSVAATASDITTAAALLPLPVCRSDAPAQAVAYQQLASGGAHVVVDFSGGSAMELSLAAVRDGGALVVACGGHTAACSRVASLATEAASREVSLHFVNLWSRLSRAVVAHAQPTGAAAATHDGAATSGTQRQGLVRAGLDASRALFEAAAVKSPACTIVGWLGSDSAATAVQKALQTASASSSGDAGADVSMKAQTSVVRV